MTLFLVIYLLTGFQIGGRMFFWTTDGKGDISSYVYCLTIVPCLWPLFIGLSFVPQGGVYKQAIFKWSEREDFVKFKK